MSDSFPYPLLQKEQIRAQMNTLASSGKSFIFIIDYKAESGYLIEDKDIDPNYLRFEINSNQIVGNNYSSKKTENNIIWGIKPVSFLEYKLKFDYVVQQICLGNSFLTNLTQPTPLTTNLSLLDMYECGTAKYKLWLNNKFVVLSPETFVRINGSTIASFPMKGTIDADIPKAEKNILNDPKERAEHATIVDLIRNDLSLVAENVEVKRYRYVEKISTNKQNLLQVSSEITGELPKLFHQFLGDILFALLPAGSICGAPKPKTLEIIEQAEAYERGFYTGVCGRFDGVNLDSAVMIRFIEQQGDQLIFKSGGGITAQSDVKKEYEELIQKIYVPIS